MKVQELIPLLGKGLKNPLKVLEGYRNNIKLENGHLSDEDIDIILKRRLICESCPFMSKNATISAEYEEAFGVNFSTSRTEDFCTQCGCPIKGKTASLSSDCGASGYQDLKGNDIPVRWYAKK